MNAPIKKIVLATDFSEASQGAHRYATWLAKTTGAKIKLLHVFDPSMWTVPSPYYFMPGFDNWIDSHLDEMREEGRKALRELEASFLESGGDEAQVESIFVEGRPGKEIVRMANSLGADLIVLGTHGYTGWNRLVLGSVAEYVVRHAPCAVLTVKPQHTDEHGV